jgi:hypothetical protein
VAGGEAVEAHDILTNPEQVLHQVGADEAGCAGDEPATRSGAQRGHGLHVWSHVATEGKSSIIPAVVPVMQNETHAEAASTDAPPVLGQRAEK